MFYKNRREAGRELAHYLTEYSGRTDTNILALPRGGVPVGAEIARQLNLPLDVLLVRKLGVPGQEELAMGAISIGELSVFNDDIIEYLNIDDAAIEKEVACEEAELKRRNHLYRDNRPMPVLESRNVIIVDDGLATGATMRAAVMAIRKACPSKIVVAVPVGAQDTCYALEGNVDELICLLKPEIFHGVGSFYDDFSQLTDREVIAILDQFRGPAPFHCPKESQKASSVEKRTS